MRRIIKIPLADRQKPSAYQPTYRETSYVRPTLQRLTPLSRFLIALAVVSLIVVGAVLAIRMLQTNDSTESLSQRLGVPNVTATPTPFAVLAFAPTEEVAPTDTPPPSPTPTPEPHRAPWADQLIKQADGTLQAPQAIIAQAMADLGAYYTIQRDLSLDDFVARRDALLKTYFTGKALAEMQKMEASRDLYSLNRAGRFSIEIRNFSADGFSAKAGVIKRNWVGDVYDIASKQMVTRGRIDKDTLTIMSILFDEASGHWKIAAIDQVTELKQ